MATHRVSTASVNGLLALAPPAPTTLTVKVADVPAVGVPESTPLVVRTSPAGGAPEVMDHEYGPTPVATSALV
ncbi:MAG: hypothetical protein V9G19_02020 [Tetrasphaera sp.]